MFEWIILGSVFSNLVLSGVFLISCLLVEEYPGYITIMLAVILLTFTGISDAHPIAWLSNNFYTFLMLVELYFTCGTVWAFGKWYFFIRKVRDVVLESHTKFLKRNNLPLDTTILSSYDKRNYDDFLKREVKFAIGSESIPPKASENKSRILSWMVYWIPSLIYTMLSDVVTKFFKEIYRFVSNWFQVIANNMFVNIPKVVVKIDE